MSFQVFCTFVDFGRAFALVLGASLLPAMRAASRAKGRSLRRLSVCQISHLNSVKNQNKTTCI